MMKHYIDITLLPSDDIGVHFLWSKLMMQVHLALVEIQNADKKVAVAVSFPQYRRKLANSSGFIGNKLRLLAPSVDDFTQLNINRWLNRLDDYVHVKAIAQIPEDVSQYESYSLPRKLGSPDGYIRRRMKRHNQTLEQASAYYADYKMDSSVKALPFIKLKSLGSDNEFNMAIKQKMVNVADSLAGDYQFNTYGFNAKAILPKF